MPHKWQIATVCLPPRVLARPASNPAVHVAFRRTTCRDFAEASFGGRRNQFAKRVALTAPARLRAVVELLSTQRDDSRLTFGALSHHLTGFGSGFCTFG